MADIKTRDVVKGTIKTVDRAAIAERRMKQSYLLSPKSYNFCFLNAKEMLSWKVTL